MPQLPVAVIRTATQPQLTRAPQVETGAVAQGLGQLAETSRQIGREMQAESERQGRVWAVKTEAQIRAGLLKTQSERVNSGEPLDGFGSFMESAAQSAIKTAMESAPNQFARQYLELSGVELAARFGVAGMEEEAKYRVNRQIAEYGEAADALASSALLDPGNTQGYLAQFDDLISDARVPFEVRENLMKTRGAIAEAGLNAAIRSNPYAAEGAIQAYVKRGDIDAGSALTLMNRAEAERKSREEEARQRQREARAAATENAMIMMAGASDYWAYRGNGGVPVPELEVKYSPQAVMGLGVPQAAEWAQDADAAFRAGDLVRRLDAAETPEERQAIANEAADMVARPENYQVNAKIAQTVVSRLRDYNEALTKTPGEVAARSGRVQEAIKSGSGQNVVAAMIAEQERRGVPEWRRVALPEGFATQVVERITSLPPEQQVQELQAIRQEYGPMWNKVWSQIGSKLPGELAVIAIMPAGRPAVLLADAISLKEGEAGSGVLKSEFQGLGDKIVETEQFQLLSRSLRLQSGSGQTLVQISNAARKLAGQYLRSDEATNADDAARKAMASITEGSTFVEMNGGVFQVPKSIDARIVEGVARGLLENPPMDIDLPPSSTGMADVDIQAAYKDAIRRNGQWVSDKENRGLYLWDGQSFVTRNGAPVLFTWDELKRVPQADTWQR